MDLSALAKVQASIRACRDCPEMCGTPVHGPALHSSLFLLGQAPGLHEAGLGKPFAYTAGRTLFKWFHEATGIQEEAFREKIYMAAVARCFPGKSKSSGGDREPNAVEIEKCRRHLKQEVAILRPKLILAVGRVAIQQSLGDSVFKKATPLAEVVGKVFRSNFLGQEVDVIPLPHPSGISSWPRVEPGKSKLAEALRRVREHPAWSETFA
ncbi:MAG: uracil-DNA glycosylase family protein [Bdellovibrionota bacterium]